MSHESLVSSKVYNAANLFAKDRTPKGVFLGAQEWYAFRQECQMHAKYYEPSKIPRADTTRFQFCGLAMVRVPVESALAPFGDEVKLGDENRISHPGHTTDVASLLYGGRPPTKEIKMVKHAAIPDPSTDLKDWPEHKVETHRVVDEVALLGRAHGNAGKFVNTNKLKGIRGFDPAFPGSGQSVTTWIDPQSGRRVTDYGGGRITLLDELTKTQMEIANVDVLQRLLASRPQPGDPEPDPTFHTKEEEPRFGGETL